MMNYFISTLLLISAIVSFCCCNNSQTTGKNDSQEKKIIENVSESESGKKNSISEKKSKRNDFESLVSELIQEIRNIKPADSLTEIMQNAIPYDSVYGTDEYVVDFSYFREEEYKISEIHKLIANSKDGDTIYIPPGEYMSQFFVLNNRHNLKFFGEPGTVWLISDDNLSTIFTISNCTNISFFGIGFLHRTAGHCTGNSLEIYHSKNIVIESCDISGCGTIGIVAHSVDSLVVKNSYLHHCTYQMMDIYKARNVYILNNLFSYNIENTSNEGISIYSIWGGMYIYNNTFSNNKSAALYFSIEKQDNSDLPTGDGIIYISKNLFYNNYGPHGSIYDDFSRDIIEKHCIDASRITIFSENIINKPTYSEDDLHKRDFASESDEYENVDTNDETNEETSITEEVIYGNFNMKNDYFIDVLDIQNDIYYYFKKNIGIFPGTISWIDHSRIPETDE